MNIIENEIPYLVEARTCGCNERGKVFHIILLNLLMPCV